MAFWISSGVQPAVVTALDARVTEAEANLGGTLHWACSSVPTTGEFNVEQFWEGGASGSGTSLRSIFVPGAAVVLFDLVVQVQSAVGGANSIAWEIEADDGAGGAFAATGISVVTPTNSTALVADALNTAQIAANARVRLHGTITGTLSSGALFPVAACRYRWVLP